MQRLFLNPHRFFPAWTELSQKFIRPFVHLFRLPAVLFRRSSAGMFLAARRPAKADDPFIPCFTNLYRLSTVGTFLAALLIVAPSHAQTPDPADYVFPVRNVQGLYSANFGEMRPNHFHSGVDIKTDGTEGKPVVAVADGYVSRLSISPSGYGRALYIALANGTTAVYGHLSRFRADLETFVRGERQRQRRNRIDLWCSADRFPVQQGDTVGFSGNSGSSFGPHLHYEIRETASQRTLNTVRLGILRPKDDLPPRIVRIHYFETDTVRGIPLHAERFACDAVETGPGIYRLTRQGPLEVGPCGHFVVEATDRRNGVANTFGLYRATLLLDEQPIFEYRMNGFTFDRSRFCNAASYYPLQIATRHEAIRLAAVEGACTDFYPVLIRRGAVGADPGQLRRIRFEAEDDCGNVSRLEFSIRGRAARPVACPPQAVVCNRSLPSLLETGEASLALPAGALYESLAVCPERRTDLLPADTTLVVLSPAYLLLDRSVPLHIPATVRLSATVPEHLRPHTTLAVLDRKGRPVHAGGSYRDGAVTARTALTGPMLVVADTLPPTVTPLFRQDADLSQTGSLGFRIGDNFSGIESCELFIDGVWAICDRYPIRGTAVHPFDTLPTRTRHSVRLDVRDACGNRTVWEGSFYR